MGKCTKHDGEMYKDKENLSLILCTDDVPVQGWRTVVTGGFSDDIKTVMTINVSCTCWLLY